MNMMKRRQSLIESWQHGRRNMKWNNKKINQKLEEPEEPEKETHLLQLQDPNLAKMGVVDKELKVEKEEILLQNQIKEERAQNQLVERVQNLQKDKVLLKEENLNQNLAREADHNLIKELVLQKWEREIAVHQEEAVEVEVQWEEAVEVVVQWEKAMEIQWKIINRIKKKKKNIKRNKWKMNKKVWVKNKWVDKNPKIKLKEKIRVLKAKRNNLQWKKCLRMLKEIKKVLRMEKKWENLACAVEDVVEDEFSELL